MMDKINGRTPEEIKKGQSFSEYLDEKLSKVNFSSLEYEDQEQKKCTPEETKKGLSLCYADVCDCSDCPYFNMEDCDKKLASDVLMLFQQLEAAQPRWISVKERLLEKHGQRCAGLYSQHGAGKSVLFPYVFTWHAYGDNGYVNGPHFSDEGLDGLKVYYWMPLPEPPMEEA